MSQPRRIDPNPDRARMFEQVRGAAPRADWSLPPLEESAPAEQASSGLPSARFTDEGIVVGDTLIPGSALGSDVVLVNLSKDIKRLDISLIVSDVDTNELPDTVTLTVRGARARGGRIDAFAEPEGGCGLTFPGDEVRNRSILAEAAARIFLRSRCPDCQTLGGALHERGCEVEAFARARASEGATEFNAHATAWSSNWPGPAFDWDVVTKRMRPRAE